MLWTIVKTRTRTDVGVGVRHRVPVVVEHPVVLVLVVVTTDVANHVARVDVGVIRDIGGIFFFLLNL